MSVLERFSYSLYQNGGLGAQEEIEKLKTEIERNKERLSNAQEMLLDKTLDPTDFKAIKSRYETTIYELEKRLRNISQEGNELDDYMRYGRMFFRSMDQFYQEGTLSVKQLLVGSMFPEKLIFENKTYRTIKENPVIPLTCKSRKGFSGLKNKKNRQKSRFVYQGSPCWT